ncbi:MULTISPECIES: hypothetical protein [unclassified Streptomyces]|uniref:hypothetical protein n=1 Tax=unclassified Streptomyces TaxID=2593676 RepID=UPI000BF1EFAE|nr:MULTISPECIES: hypothetical protein [unclassified Streptomyces]
MGAGKYRGPGGLVVLLDEPLNSEMAKQLSSGQLSRVGGAPESEAAEKPESSGPDVAVAKPAAAAKADDWKAYAVSLGMSEEDAATATKKDCQEYVQVIEDTNEGQE